MLRVQKRGGHCAVIVGKPQRRYLKHRKENALQIGCAYAARVQSIGAKPKLQRLKRTGRDGRTTAHLVDKRRILEIGHANIWKQSR